MNARSPSFGVPASSLGHHYQSQLALVFLFRAAAEDAGASLTIEREDDIAVAAGGGRSAAQAKHHLEPTRALTDTSVDLWKTLRVWSEGIRDGSFDVARDVFVLATTETARPGSAAALLRPNDAGPGRDEAAALDRLLDAAVATRNTESAAGVAAFRKLSRVGQQALLRRIQVLDASPPATDLRAEIERALRLAVRPNHMAACYERVLGWWEDRVTLHLAAPAGDRITADELLRFVWDLGDRFTTENLPIDADIFAAEVPDELTEGQRTFVRQLQLIALHNRSIAAAVRDYYRASEQRSRWLRDDLLYVTELQAYERRLREEWEQHFGLMCTRCDAADDGAKRAHAQALYDRVVLGLDVRIRPACAETFVMRGSLHILADRREVGWHPDFVERLQALLTTEAKVGA